MRIVLTPEEMRLTEKAAPVSTFALMENAYTEAAKRLPAGKTVYFACGKGMNGGDGFGAAARYQEKGTAVVLRVPEEEEIFGDAKAEYEACRHAGCAIVVPDALAQLPAPDIWVDALFGIGLSRPVEGVYEEIISRILSDRERGSRVVALDIPSGICAQTGSALGAHVRADETYCFGFLKPGHILSDGCEASGAVSVCDIGVPAPENPPRLAETEDALHFLPKRARNTHKGTYGHLLVWAGAFGMAGAAHLCALAALRSGAGLVTVACPERIVPILQAAVPCAMCIPLPEDKAAARDVFAASLRGKSAVAAGCGLSQHADAELLRALLQSGLPAVLDADALNILSRNGELLPLLSNRHVITPHPGEAARLLQRPCGDTIRDAKALCALGCVALLKGATSIICGQHITFSASGTPAMAKGGSGDVLTGMIGAFLAQGMPPEDAAWCASELHGRAGEIASQRTGEYALLATDLIVSLPEAFRP
ncbi:MAG: NAD(P)H-hydrate dehydratase [Christensenellales bacterium]|jgi:hydroxyethylthiazole kinase-like uncharacterized protein yjeF